MPPVRSPKKSDWHYRHEELFYWLCVGILALAALGVTGPYFVIGLFLIGMISPFIFLAWWGWREWYIDREDRRLERNDSHE